MTEGKEQAEADVRGEGGGSPVDADVCIVGSGVAGALTAYRLGRAGIRTVVLEAGPRQDPEGAAERMARFRAGENPWRSDWPERDAFSSVGEVDYPLNEHRVRAVGNTTLHWIGYTPRFVESDFRMRSRYGLAEDWPISYHDLEPYGEAEIEMGVAGADDNPFGGHRSSEKGTRTVTATSTKWQMFSGRRTSAPFATTSDRTTRAPAGWVTTPRRAWWTGTCGRTTWTTSTSWEARTSSPSRS